MKSNAKLSLEQTETTRKITIDIPNEETEKITAGIIKNNHLRGLYSDYCILNQEFLSYVLSCNLSQAQYKLFIYFISQMDRENKVLINNQLLINKFNLSEPTVISSLKKLVSKGIIIKQKLNVSNYEIQINYDILNPALAFKDKANKENVMKHKGLMSKTIPYIKQMNIYGGIDLINSETGEVFEQYSEEESNRHLIGAEKPNTSFLIENK